MTHSRFITIGFLAVLLAWSGFVAPASAGGYEFPSAGARSLGRGAASLARADDPYMALLNPAALASMPAQIMVGTQLVFQKSCFDRDGNVDPTYVNGATNVPNANVCNGEDVGDRFSLLPMIGGTMRLHKRVGMLLALDPPYSTREMIWETAVRDPQGTRQPGFYNAPPGVTATPINDGLVPSPARYMLVNSNVVLLYPTISFGVKLADWFQIGAGFSWGFARFNFTNYTAFSLTSMGGESPAQDTPTEVVARDWFVPRFIGSLHFIPHDRVDIMAGVRWDDDIRASGQTKAQVPGLGEATGDVSYVAPKPMWVTFGIRYAHRTTPRKKLSEATGPSGATDDPMKNETFDIEANVVYERNSTVDNHLFNASTLTVGTATPITIPPFPQPIKVPHMWQDQVSVRLGADYNVMPGQLAIRLGASYETVGFTDGFGYIDYLPMQRFGIHAGLSGRFGAVELTLGYAAFFHTDFNNPNGKSPQIVIGLNGPEPIGGFINSGLYTSRIHTLGWSLRAVFD